MQAAGRLGNGKSTLEIGKAFFVAGLQGAGMQQAGLKGACMQGAGVQGAVPFSVEPDGKVKGWASGPRSGTDADAAAGGAEDFARAAFLRLLWLAGELAAASQAVERCASAFARSGRGGFLCHDLS